VASTIGTLAAAADTSGRIRRVIRSIAVAETHLMCDGSASFDVRRTLGFWCLLRRCVSTLLRGPSTVAALVVAQRHCEPVRCGRTDPMQGAANAQSAEVCASQKDYVAATCRPAIHHQGRVP